MCILIQNMSPYRHRNRWICQTICAIYFSDFTYRNKDSDVFLTNSPLTCETESDILKIYLYQSTWSVFRTVSLLSFLSHPQCCCHKPRNVQQNISKSSLYLSAAVIHFRCEYAAILEEEAVLRRATLVESMCRLRPHCTRAYPSSMRGTAITKTFTALWKNTTSHDLSVLPSVW